MSLLPGTAAKTFNLLSVGQRGVGKTVFLAGSYGELHSGSQTDHSQQLWFDCQDAQAEENITSILQYIARTGQYPPPTMKITDFNFSLKRQSPQGDQTVCRFLWWDIPGEICDIRNLDFREMVSTSHGCCVFIDAYELMHKSSHQESLEDIQQVMAIASLVSLNHLEYAFAVVLTKCDLLEPDLLNRIHLQDDLQSLTHYLENVNVSYQIFRSNIPIISTKDNLALGVSGAAAPLLWLVCKLDQIHNANSKPNQFKLGTRLRAGNRDPQTPGGLTQSLHRTTARQSRTNKLLGLSRLRWRSLPVTYRYFLIVMCIGFVGVISTFFLDFKWYQGQNQGFDASTQAEPEHLVRLQQARSYEAVGQLAKAEALYDEIIAEQKNNLDALVSKAILRHAQGDTKTAKVLFAQAENTAPAAMKGQIRTVAQETLQTPNKPTPSAK